MVFIGVCCWLGVVSGQAKLLLLVGDKVSVAASPALAATTSKMSVNSTHRAVSTRLDLMGGRA
jgi:hypothetical protein